LASVVAVGGSVGTTFTLTAGADTIVGAGTNDVINALSINADGAAANTLTAFDSIDGGAGNDTLNIYTGAGFNASLPTNLTVKNVETINYLNADAGVATIDASKFVGATTINQTGFAGDLTNLAATTKAVFTGVTAKNLDKIQVGAADTATSATIALDGVKGSNYYTNVAYVNVGGLALNSVNVDGTLAQRVVGDVAPTLKLNVSAGKDVQSLAIDTTFNTTLAVSNAGGKPVTTVDASASTGAVTYITAANTVANIKTGAGNDTATLIFAGTATANAATLSTGAGNDVLNVNVTKGTATAVTAAVDAGEGNDIINVVTNAGVTYNVAAGAGDDIVVIAGTVKTTDKIDGGAGTDTVSLSNNGTLVADDYIVFNKVLTNFETLKLTNVVTGLDADQLAANYSTVDLAAGSTVTNVGTQALVAHGSLTATAKGYVAGTTTTYAGTLNITDKATGVIFASADKVALTVDASANNAIVTLAGDAQSASVTLVQALNTAKTAYLGAATFNLTTMDNDANLAGLTLAGNGTAFVDNLGGKLVNVDASALNSVDVAGKAAAGLTYISINSAAETIKLGAGIDHVTLGASTYGNADVVTGLNLVASATDAKNIDFTANNSDTLIVGGITSASNIIKFTTTQTDLSFALKDAAAFSADNAGANLVFQQGGNTYVFHDAGGSSGAGNGLIDGADTVVQLTGQVNLDLLSSALLHNVA
jgi:hypothetical protein